MTKRSEDQTCRRCGENQRGPGRSPLCGDCYGRCATCGDPTPMTAAGFHRTYCGKCRRAAETRETCTKCGKRRDGSHQSYCNACYRKYSREHRRERPEVYRAKERRSTLRQKYGMTIGDYEAKFQAQGGVCAICKQPPPEGKNLQVDHCHTTGAVRSLLCGTCNTALGHAMDDPDLLIAMAAYLTRFLLTNTVTNRARMSGSSK